MRASGHHAQKQRSKNYFKEVTFLFYFTILELNCDYVSTNNINLFNFKTFFYHIKFSIIN